MNIFSFKKNKNKGYSIFELIVYVSIFSVLSIVVINTLLTSTRSFALTRTNRSLSHAGASFMERVSREIRNSSDIVLVESLLNQNQGMLVLLGGDGTSETSFEMEDNDILLYEDDVLIGSVLGEGVIADNLVFRNISASNLSAIKIELTLTDVRGNNNKSVNFYNTIILRGSYE